MKLKKKKTKIISKRYSRFFYARSCSCLDIYFYLTAWGIPAAPMLAAVAASINIVTYQHGVYQLLLAVAASIHTVTFQH